MNSNTRTGFLNLDHWILSRCLDKFLEICTAVSLKYVPMRKIDGSSKSKSQTPRERKNLMGKRRRINLN